MIKNFFTVLFGEVGSGRLNRMQFLGYLFSLFLLMILVVGGTILLAGGLERMSGDPQQMQATIMEHLGLPVMIAFMLLGLAYTFAVLNLSAKRIRDMGLPAWPMVAVIVVLGLGIAYLFPGTLVTVNGMQQIQPSPVSATFKAIVFLALALIPGNAFGRKE